MSIDISGVMEECESRRQLEREMWRVCCRGGRDQTIRREVETAAYSSSYSEVVAVAGRGQGGMGAIGEGWQSLQWRGGREVSVLCAIFVVDLLYCSPRAQMMTCR